MKHFDFDNQWDAIKGQLKQRYGQLTDDDLAYVQGKGDELLALLRVKLGLTATELNATLHDLQAQAGGRFQEVKAKAGELADEARAKAGAIADDLREKAAAFTGEAKAQGAAAYDQARQRVRTLRGDGDEYVRQNPRNALLAALCAGFVVGMLIRR